MAAITQAVHKQKTIYLVPLRSLAEEKFHHFKVKNIFTLVSKREIMLKLKTDQIKIN